MSRNSEIIYASVFGRGTLEISCDGGGFFLPSSIGIKVPDQEKPWCIPAGEGKELATAILKSLGAPVIEEVSVPNACTCGFSDDCSCDGVAPEEPEKSPIVQRYNEIYDELTDGMAPGTETSNIALALLKIERGAV